MQEIIAPRPFARRGIGRTGLQLFLLPLAACAGSRPPVTTSAATFDPLVFFSQPTHGDGRLKIAFRPAVAFHVEGRGTVDADGTLRLEQTVSQAGKPPTHRAWNIRRVGIGHYRGTLSDANGPVDVVTTGGVLRVRFAMRHGLRAEQWLVLAPDGQSTTNRMIVRKFGIPVARVDERIVRDP